MPATPHDAATGKQADQPSLLLNLPVELQLDIYELAVVEDEPLLLNCACNSSYRGRWNQLEIDEKAWESRLRHAPRQPALTQTCNFIRNLALPIFYNENLFRAHYCRSANFDNAMKWLTTIGPRNRAELLQMYLYDRNDGQDRYDEQAILKAKEKLSAIFGASAEPVEAKQCTYHHAVFPGRTSARESKTIVTEERITNGELYRVPSRRLRRGGVVVVVPAGDLSSTSAD